MSALTMTREQAIEALEARRDWAQQRDEKARKAYEKDCYEQAKRFRAQCREHGKKSLKQLVDEALERTDYGRRGVRIDNLNLDSCPRSTEAQLDRQLNVLRATRQTRLTAGQTGRWSDLFWLLTHDDEITSKVCD